jgi:hypothetical protein
MKKLLVLLVAGAFVLGLTLPAMSADKSVDFYGRVWMDTFSVDNSKEHTGLTADDNDLLWNLEGNGTSRFGANFKWDNLTANVEIRPLSTSVYRQWWGAWNFGPGTILVGHTWSPLYLNTTITNQSQAGGSMGGFGFFVGDLRRAQLTLKTKGLTLALVEPSTNVHLINPTTDFDTSLPKVEATYALNVGQFSLVPFFGYQTYDEVDTTNNNSYSIDGMVYGLTAKASFGPGYVNGQIWKTENGREWGDLYHKGQGAWYDAANNKIVDEDGLGYSLVAGMKINDIFSFEAGYGHVEYDLNRPGKWENDAAAYYAQLTINIAKGFMLCPEIGKIDYGDSTQNGVKTELGDTTYYGAVWKIHF